MGPFLPITGAMISVGRARKKYFEDTLASIIDLQSLINALTLYSSNGGGSYDILCALDSEDNEKLRSFFQSPEDLEAVCINLDKDTCLLLLEALGIAKRASLAHLMTVRDFTQEFLRFDFRNPISQEKALVYLEAKSKELIIDFSSLVYFLDTIPKSLHTSLLSILRDALLSLITTPEQVGKILPTLNDYGQDFIIDTLQFRLITDTDSLEKFLKPLTSNQRKLLLIKLSDKLPELITSATDLDKILKCLAEEDQKALLFDILKDKLASLITSTYDACLIIPHLTREQETIPFDLIVSQLPELIEKSAARLSLLLRCLTPDESRVVLEIVGSELPNIISSLDELAIIMSCLASSEWEYLKSFLTNKLPILHNSAISLTEAINRFTEKNKAKFLTFLGHNLINSIKSFDDLKTVLSIKPDLLLSRRIVNLIKTPEEVHQILQIPNFWENLQQNSASRELIEARIIELAGSEPLDKMFDPYINASSSCEQKFILLRILQDKWASSRYNLLVPHNLSVPRHHGMYNQSLRTAKKPELIRYFTQLKPEHRYALIDDLGRFSIARLEEIFLPTGSITASLTAIQAIQTTDPELYRAQLYGITKAYWSQRSSNNNTFLSGWGKFFGFSRNRKLYASEVLLSAMRTGRKLTPYELAQDGGALHEGRLYEIYKCHLHLLRSAPTPDSIASLTPLRTI